MTIFPFVSAVACRAILCALAFHFRGHLLVKLEKIFFVALVLLVIRFAVRGFVEHNWTLGNAGQNMKIVMAAVLPFQVEWVRPLRLHIDLSQLVATPGPAPLSSPEAGGAANRSAACCSRLYGDIVHRRSNWGV